jgi:ankyrin repeat protein
LQPSKVLLEQGADPFMKNGNGMTALSLAEIFGKRAANHLRKVMAISPEASELGMHDAARAGLLARVQALVDQGTPIDGRDDMGRSALHWTAIGGKADLVRVLLDLGANRSTRATRTGIRRSCLPTTSRPRVFCWPPAPIPMRTSAMGSRRSCISRELAGLRS